MKILFISDIHLGVKQNSEFMLNVTREFFDKQVIPAIETHDVGQLWIAGDYFDNRYTTDVRIDNASMVIIENLLDKFKDLEIKLLVGNHDIFYKNSLLVGALKKFEYFDERVEVIKTVNEYKVDGCKILAVPWLIQGSENWTKFRKVVDEYNETKKKQYDLCVGHFEINGFEVVKNVVHEDGLKQSDFNAFGLTYSGHFHIRNKINNIQYLGSPFEITWNDYGNQKGITIFDTKTKTDIFIPNDLSPKHKHIKISSLIDSEEEYEEFDNSITKFHIDTNIDESELTDILTKINQKKLFNLQVIDERYDDINHDDVEMDDSEESDSLEYALEYVENIELGDELELKNLKKRLIALYNKAVSEKD